MTDPTTEPRACPTGCGRTARPDQLLCLPCWNTVPRALQRRVYGLWAEVRDEVDGALEVYRQVALEAVTAAAQHLPEAAP